MGSVNCNYLPYVGSGIIVSAVHFWEVSCVVNEVAKKPRESPACHISYEF